MAALIRSVIDQVEVDDTEIRIIGRKTILERLVKGGGALPAGVPSFVRKWRAIQDKTANIYAIEILTKFPTRKATTERRRVRSLKVAN